MEVFMLAVMSVVVYSVFTEKHIMSPKVIFATEWGIVVFLAALGLYDMLEFSNDGYVLITLGGVGFLIGCFMSKKYSFSFNKKKLCFERVAGYRVGKYGVFIMLIIAFIGYAMLSLSVLSLLKSGINYSAIRSMYFGYGQYETFMTNSTVSRILDWVCFPCLLAAMPLSLFELSKGKRSYLNFILLLIDLALYVFSTAGRIIILYFIIEIMVLSIRSKISIPKKLKKWIKYFIILGIIAIVFMTSMRVGESSDILKSVYQYFSISPSLLTYWKEYADSHNYCTYGAATSYGLLSVLQWLMAKVHIYMPAYSNISTMVNAPQNEWVRIFAKNDSNAFVSMYYYFYLDFGYIGVFFESFIYGLIVYESYKKAEYNDKALVLYMFLAVGVFLSLIRWQFATSPWVIALILILVVMRKKIENEK